MYVYWSIVWALLLPAAALTLRVAASHLRPKPKEIRRVTRGR